MRPPPPPVCIPDDDAPTAVAVAIGGVRCTYTWNGQRPTYVYEAHAARTGAYFEPEDWVDIEDANELKRRARQSAEAKAARRQSAVDKARGGEGTFCRQPDHRAPPRLILV